MDTLKDTLTLAHSEKRARLSVAQRPSAMPCIRWMNPGLPRTGPTLVHAHARLPKAHTHTPSRKLTPASRAGPATRPASAG